MNGYGATQGGSWRFNANSDTVRSSVELDWRAMSESADGIPWVLEGMTAQYAGELLFRHQATETVRTRCRDSYVACLDNWLLAALYSGRIHVALPPGDPDGRKPGQQIIQEFGKIVEVITLGQELRAEELLTSDEFRQSIGDDIKRLDVALSQKESIWTEWITRETEKYFGNHQSVQQDLEPGKFIFEKSPPLMYDKELIKEMPHTSRSYLENVVNQHLSDSSVRPRAVSDFVSRNVLTLITISRWYDVAESKNKGIRFPSPVRSLIYQTADPKLVKKLDVLKNISLVGALDLFVNKKMKVNSSGDLINCTLEAREHKLVKQVRHIITNLAHILADEQGRTKKRDTELLIRDASKAAGRLTDSEESLRKVRLEHEEVLETSIERIQSLFGNHSGNFVKTLNEMYPELNGMPMKTYDFGKSNTFGSNVVIGEGNVVARDIKESFNKNKVAGEDIKESFNRVAEAKDSKLWNRLKDLFKSLLRLFGLNV